MSDDFTTRAGPERPDVMLPGESRPRPKTIGPYHVLEELGEGGFGIVYEAEQREPLRRRVAVKLIKPGMDSDEVVARFEAERQALALMDHPSIARVLDGGMTGPELGSRPYFVMELVKGVPITEHCDMQQLTIEDRCRLFIRVCEAVQHAHTKGVVHRDLKPSNVLVSYGDDGAVPKIIDFGVAKALNTRLTEKTIFTERGQLIGTPEYMSPEQAEMSGQDIDTRADIYSLGVLLYELLTGVLPFEPGVLRAAAFAEVQRMIRETEPPRPSTKFSTMLRSGETLKRAEALGKARRSDAKSIAGALKQDLDWVVMRSLEKDRDRRYQSATALGEELQRYLASEPVHAGPPSAGYRLKKFVRRNPTLAWASVISLTILLLGSLGTTVGFIRAEAARIESERSLDRAEQAISLFEEIFSSLSPGESAGMDTELVRLLLNRGAERVDAEVSDPQLERDMRHMFGYSLMQIGQYPEASKQLARALEASEEAFGVDSDESASLANVLGECYWEMERFEDADRVLDRYLALSEGSATIEASTHARLLTTKGVTLDLRRRSAEAVRFYEQAVDVIESLGGDHPRLRLNVLGNLALAYRKQGQIEESIVLQEQVVEERTRIDGAAANSTLRSKQNLLNAKASLRDRLSSEGRTDEAMALGREVAAGFVDVLAPYETGLVESPYDQVWPTINAALAFAFLSENESADRYFGSALRLAESIWGPDGGRTAEFHLEWARSYVRRGDYESAQRRVDATHGIARVDAMRAPIEESIRNRRETTGD